MRHNGPLSQDLVTSDINGAASSTKGLGPFFGQTRKDFRQTNNIGDIMGTSASSLKKAPVS